VPFPGSLILKQIFRRILEDANAGLPASGAFDREPGQAAVHEIGTSIPIGVHYYFLQPFIRTYKQQKNVVKRVATVAAILSQELRSAKAAPN
jgi:hypothetical protein